MNSESLYLLVSTRKDGALMGHWSFRASDELAVARHILRDFWTYEDVFWALRISMREVDEALPEDLLKAIHDSYPNLRVRAALHLIRVPPPAQCPS